MIPTSSNSRPETFGEHRRPAVQQRLTARRRRTVVENDDYAAFTRRIVAGHGRRIASGDIEGLAALAQLADDVDAALTTAVTGLRIAGYSWAEIADRLGISRQAAHQRFAAVIRATGVYDSETLDMDPDYQRHAHHGMASNDPDCPYCPTEDDLRQWEAESSPHGETR